MSGPTVASASTGQLTAMLSIDAPAAVLASATAVANGLVAKPVANAALMQALIDDAAAEGSPGQVTVLHRNVRIAAPLAAAINGAAMPSDGDEIFVPAFAASLAAAEYARAPSAAWLAGFAAGAEVSARLARAWSTDKPRQFIPASAVGQIGATLAVCRILGLAPAATAAALGFSAIQLSGTAPAGTPEYALSVGNAARVAIEVAFIAGFGVSGPLNAVEAAGLMLAAPHLADQLAGLAAEWIIGGRSEHAEALDRRIAALLD